MSLDLFFVTRKPAFTELRDSAYTPTTAMTRARRKLVAELLEAHPGSRLEGDASKGWLADFPRGELSLHPGYIHWSLHGVDDIAPVQEVVNWFQSHGQICEDPQDAGFGNRDLKRGVQRSSLKTFDELVGAQFNGIRLLREWGTGIAMEWTLADGSPVVVEFVRFETCRLPDLGALLTRKVTAVHFETAERDMPGFDTLRVFFEGDLELFFDGGIFHKSVITRKA